MTNSAKTLAKHLAELVLDSNFTITELSRSAKIDRTSLYKYLNGEQVPRLDVLDKVADVLGKHPWDLIRPEDQPFTRAHTLEDCLNVVNQAFTNKPLHLTFQSGSESVVLKAQGNINDLINNTRTTPEIAEAISILSTLDDEHCRRALIAIKSVARTYASSAASIREKKAK